jgi:hypothetical protein
MIAGTRERFAIEAEVTERIETWILGHIRFWICGEPVGNWADSADLRGCINWLREFHDMQVDRHEPDLVDLPADEVFRLVYDNVMPGGTPFGHPWEHEARRRFHISYLGMSSFELFDILLLTNALGAERCLWRAAGSTEIHDCRLWRREMESVAGEFCTRFESVMRAARASESP